MQGLGCVRSTLQGITLPKDVARWAANRADNERRQTRRQRSATRTKRPRTATSSAGKQGSPLVCIG
jgi:hypothetical protein